jgi:CheY-like chemotaxis protein
MKQLHVLLAEDDPDYRYLTSRVLRSSGEAHVHVDAVADGAEALDYLYRRGGYEDKPAPNLVVLALRMPKVSGLEVLAQVKSDPDLQAIPVLVLTGSDHHEDVEETYRLGGNSFVTKPAGLEGLVGIATYWTARASLPEPVL